MQGIDTKQLGKVLVTGGTGFIGSYLVKRLVDESVDVRVFDNNVRGRVNRLGNYIDRLEFINGDVCDFDQVNSACQNVDTVFHLAFINGTDNFYNFPEKVLEIGVKGALSTLEAAIKQSVSQYIVTSSSEVYQEPTHVPTKEDERIIIPDLHNPRFSYSGGKIITELLTLHYPAKTSLKTVICRPHNFYGPDMGMGHVIPQFVTRMKELSENFKLPEIDFPIQGSGNETRSFCYIDDAVDGLLLLALQGENQNIYHLGTEQEKSIIELANEIANILGIKINIQKGNLLQGGTTRRCPSIKKARALGYNPKIDFRRGLEKTVHWYVNQIEFGNIVSQKEIIR